VPSFWLQDLVTDLGLTSLAKPYLASQFGYGPFERYHPIRQSRPVALFVLKIVSQNIDLSHQALYL
jgi:hypothetical protein